MDIERKIEKIEGEVAEIHKYVNDMSHTVVRMEESVEWIKTMLKWGFTIIAFLMGLLIGI